MSVYRTHQGGIHSLTGEEKQTTSYLTNILILGDIFHEERSLFVDMFVNVLSQKINIMPDDFFDNLFVHIALHVSKDCYRDVIKKLILEKSNQEKVILECNNYITLLESQSNKSIIKHLLKTLLKKVRMDFLIAKFRK
ncbi:hypothetical protein IBE48_08840 [Francisella philomiragia]|uniref:Uncharacterized protein n=1 Tax=Francisella philomiragia TaxID=28110 RepID=A0AAW3D937_9GAMM|nr:hypothetical protein [Francisella philomiragia]KFJ41865.1 hypothetical protein DR78_471 [Francisella philomiragia]MBK2255613.1 hypothetical protein [Francisella philomiragia]MBK2273895.1 hypothetical protein [Francisella philomiragia]MBK2277768.1 hypothetical protein [Francisella philomiragia]MBK2281686.1 hypothetical protein [Francisella philomiragia]